MYISLLFASIILAVFAQLLFKAFSLSKPEDVEIYFYLINYKLLGGFLLYFLSAILYLYALKKIDLSIAYPTISISYILIIFLSYYLFGEAVTSYKILGSILILLGVFFIWK